MAEEAGKSEAPAAEPSRARRILAKAIALGASLLVAGALAEGAFRFVEWREEKASWQKGQGGFWTRDPRWGWKVTKGDFEIQSPEFHLTGSVNDLWMNDPPVDAEADKQKTRVLALGDSHTYAVGVSMTETWPRVLEGDLAKQSPGHAWRVYNAGTSGYNLHQYLLRLTDQGPLLHPDYVVLGFSYATDLYDLLPPGRGGWIYGWPDQPRDYFDFDDKGDLTERHWTPPAASAAAPVDEGSKTMRVRGFLTSFAMVRYFRRSNIGLALGSRLSVGGQSLWANLEIVVEKETRPEHEYQWRLAKALLLRIRDEAKRQGAQLVVAGIPYLPQVYDDVWKVTFGGDPRYSRTAAIERLSAFCAENGIVYVDTLDALRKRSTELKRRLHFPKDAHPTAEGQAVIAQTIADAGALKPAR
jgi:lysophospholipase L1-like esterase